MEIFIGVLSFLVATGLLASLIAFAAKLKLPAALAILVPTTATMMVYLAIGSTLTGLLNSEFPWLLMVTLGSVLLGTAIGIAVILKRKSARRKSS